MPLVQPKITLTSAFDTLILDAFDGWGITDLDLGDAETRTVRMPVPDTDGEFDFTQFIGARVITVSLEIVPFSQTVFNMIKRLAGFTNPRAGATFAIQLTDDAPELIIPVQRSKFGNPLKSTTINEPVVQWVAPSGAFKALIPTLVTVNPASSGTEAGRTYDLVYDRAYPTSAVLGSGFATNNGNIDAYPLLRVYGPCTNPTITNDTQGKSLVFTGLTINAGEFLEVDMYTHTVRYQGLASDARYFNLSFPATRWWTLQQGTNQIRFLPTTSSGASKLEINFSDTYLL